MNVHPLPSRVQRWTRPLAEATAAHGGKAAHLARLRAAGFDVPDGFVVEAEAHRAWKAAGRQVAPALAAEVVAAWRSLGGGPVAVRSSAVGEDGVLASFAGQFETVLDVSGEEALLRAIVRCWAAAEDGRVAAYQAGLGADEGGLSLLVQSMVAARAAGVAFTADPISGERGLVLVSAIPGVGEALVSGQQQGEDWRVDDTGSRRLAGPRAVLTEGEAAGVAELARRVEAHFGAPQDIEWALQGDQLRLLQARPMTALPEPVAWESPVPEALVRNLRLGEWIGGPVTPLFADWLVHRIEDRLYAFTLDEFGMELPRPAHVLIHGWYFYRVPGLPRLFEIPRILWRSLLFMLKDPFRALGYEPAAAHLGMDRNGAFWREEVLPAYHASVAHGWQRLGSMPVTELPGMVDEVADRVGDHFVSMLAGGGAASKIEGHLRRFWNEHLEGKVEGDVLELVRGFPPSEVPTDHAVQGLDWSLPTMGELGLEVPAPPAEALGARRQALMAECRAALADQPSLLKRFDRWTGLADRAHRLREEQAAAFTLAWPLFRAALRRMAKDLVEREVIATEDDVWWLYRAELEAGLEGRKVPAETIAARRREGRRSSQLRPPLIIGELPKPWKMAYEHAQGGVRPMADAPAGSLPGLSASPGRVAGMVRVLSSLEDLERLQPGEVLVTQCTTPAWTPAFARAGAVVTESGSAFSHAAVVAREYGVPAVVACEGATGRLRDGEVVVVDGTRGRVERLAVATG